MKSDKTLSFYVAVETEKPSLARFYSLQLNYEHEIFFRYFWNNV